MKYVDLPHNKKLNLLRAHSFNCEWPDLEQEHWCLHCGQQFSGHSVRVWQDREGKLWLECGTPDCDGSPIDWAPYPWWESRISKAQKSPGKRKPKRKRRKKGGADDDVPF